MKPTSGGIPARDKNEKIIVSKKKLDYCEILEIV